MKKALILTDLTRMQEGRVCIAGYDESGQCIRPVLPPPGIQESSLYSQGRAIIYPFAVVEFELLRPTPEPPHTEDHRYEPSTVRFIEKVEEKRKRQVLLNSTFPTVQAIFEVPIYSDVGHYVMAGQGSRSLGTLQPKRVIKAIYEQDPSGKWKYRLGFVDGGDCGYWLTVTDLAWRYYCDHNCRKGIELGDISNKLTHWLRSNAVFLRIGLARGWEKFPDRCFLQVTGVYTFPDYLEGKIFADLTTRN